MLSEFWNKYVYFCQSAKTWVTHPGFLCRKIPFTLLIMSNLPHWCGWEQEPYVTRFTVGDFSALWSGVTRIFTVGLKWNLGQDQDRLGTGAILDRSAPCTAALCCCSNTLTSGPSAWQWARWHAEILTWAQHFCHLVTNLSLAQPSGIRCSPGQEMPPSGLSCPVGCGQWAL